MKKVYLPDVAYIASQYKEWAEIGTGIGNYMTYGDFTDSTGAESSFIFPRGRILGRDLSKVAAVDHAKIAETVAHSWYEYSGGDENAIHPWQGETKPKYEGPAPPFETLEGFEKYTWLKAPRYEGGAYEVGPLARMLVGYAAGNAPIKTAVDSLLAKLGVGPSALFSTLGRIAARALETQILVDKLPVWLEELRKNMTSGQLAVADNTLWDPAKWPAEAQGWGSEEAPRGALGHWVVIKDRKVANYQLVVPSTWNGSPRDAGRASRRMGGGAHRHARRQSLLSPSRFFAPSTRSTHAWPAPYMSTTHAQDRRRAFVWSERERHMPRGGIGGGLGGGDLGGPPLSRGPRAGGFGCFGGHFGPLSAAAVGFLFGRSMSNGNARSAASTREDDLRRHEKDYKGGKRKFAGRGITKERALNTFAKPILVLGIGNILMGDEGAGVHLARALTERIAALPAGTVILDGGTLGLELLDDVEEAGSLIVLDAVNMGGEAGTRCLLRGDEIFAVFGAHLRLTRWVSPTSSRLPGYSGFCQPASRLWAFSPGIPGSTSI